MKRHITLNIVGCVALTAFAIGCAGNRAFQHSAVLRQDPAWPKIRCATELEVAHKEGNTRWSSSAYYEPDQHTNGVWYVVASGAYPLNRYGDSIDILLRDNGDIISYAPRLSDHPR